VTPIIATLSSDEVADDVLPRPPRWERLTASSFTGLICNSIDGCNREMAARTLAIGECAEGVGAPARFVPDEEAARFGLGEADY